MTIPVDILTVFERWSDINVETKVDLLPIFDDLKNSVALVIDQVGPDGSYEMTSMVFVFEYMPTEEMIISIFKKHPMMIDFEKLFDMFGIRDINDLIIHYDTLKNCNVRFVDYPHFYVDNAGDFIINQDDAQFDATARLVDMGHFAFYEGCFLKILNDNPGSKFYILTYNAASSIVKDGVFRMSIVNPV